MSLPEQIQRFPKEDLIHIQWSVQSPHASMGDKVRVAHLYRHCPRLQPATAQTTTNIFCQVEQRALQEGDINGVFLKGGLPGDRLHCSPTDYPTEILTLGPLSPVSYTHLTLPTNRE